MTTSEPIVNSHAADALAIYQLRKKCRDTNCKAVIELFDDGSVNVFLFPEDNLLHLSSLSPTKAIQGSATISEAVNEIA